MNKSEKFFDRVSSKSKPELSKTTSKIIESSKEFLKKDNNLLDFGYGYRAITNKLSKVAKTIDAIDISSGMLKFAKKQAEEKRSASEIIKNMPALIRELQNSRLIEVVSESPSKISIQMKKGSNVYGLDIFFLTSSQKIEQMAFGKFN